MNYAVLVPRHQTILKFRDFRDFIDNCYDSTFTKPSLETGAIKVAYEVFVGYISNPDTVKELEKIDYVTLTRRDELYAEKLKGYYGKVNLKPAKWFREFSKLYNFHV